MLKAESRDGHKYKKSIAFLQKTYSTFTTEGRWRVLFTYLLTNVNFIPSIQILGVAACQKHAKSSMHDLESSLVIYMKGPKEKLPTITKYHALLVSKCIRKAILISLHACHKGKICESYYSQPEKENA